MAGGLRPLDRRADGRLGAPASATIRTGCGRQEEGSLCGDEPSWGSACSSRSALWLWQVVARGDRHRYGGESSGDDHR